MASGNKLLLLEQNQCNNGIYGLCFEVEAKERTVMILGLVLKFRYQCTFCVKTSPCTLSSINRKDSSATKWTHLCRGSDQGLKKENHTFFDEAVVLSPGEKRCFLVYKTHRKWDCTLEVADGMEKVEDENVIFYGSQWNTNADEEAGERIPTFTGAHESDGTGFTIDGGLIYEMSCDLKPAKRS